MIGQPIAGVRRALDCVPSGEVEYQVVRAPDGNPIAKVGTDCAANPGAGTLWQMATIEELRGLGIGTHVISAAEYASENAACPSPNWTSRSTIPGHGLCTNVSDTARQVADPPPGTSKTPTERQASTRRTS
jgi:hypothetical protein